MSKELRQLDDYEQDKDDRRQTTRMRPVPMGVQKLKTPSDEQDNPPMPKPSGSIRTDHGFMDSAPTRASGKRKSLPSLWETSSITSSARTATRANANTLSSRKLEMAAQDGPVNDTLKTSSTLGKSAQNAAELVQSGLVKRQSLLWDSVSRQSGQDMKQQENVIPRAAAAGIPRPIRHQRSVSAFHAVESHKPESKSTSPESKPTKSTTRVSSLALPASTPKQSPPSIATKASGVKSRLAQPTVRPKCSVSQDVAKRRQSTSALLTSTRVNTEPFQTREPRELAKKVSLIENETELTTSIRV